MLICASSNIRMIITGGDGVEYTMILKIFPWPASNQQE